jgi:hypothetical protein
MSKLVFIIAQSCLAAALAASAAAQAAPKGQPGPPHTGAVAGVVHDSLGNALARVEVAAAAVGRSVRSDSAGRFLLAGLPPGALDLTIRRLDYTPAVASVDIDAGDTAQVEIRLSVAAQQLSAVVVTADPEVLHRLDAFEARRKEGIGHFITRGQIEQRHPLLLSDMVRLIPGTVLIPTDNGRTALRFSRASRNCPPQFYVDGMQVYGFSIDDLMPGDIDGIELYAGAAGVPPEFNRLHSTAICGTVVIWTRVEGGDKKK